MSGRGRTTHLRDVMVAVVVLGSILLLVLAGAKRSRGLTVERRLVSDQAELGDAAVELATGLERGLHAVEALAAEPAEAGSTVATDEVPGADQVAIVGVGPDHRAVGHELVPSAQLALSQLAVVMARARDTGEPQVGPLMADGAAGWVPVVAARFSDAPSTLAGSTARRAALSGWVVALVHPEELVTTGDALAASLSDRATSAVIGDREPPARAPETTVTVGRQAFTLRAGDPAGIGFIGTTVALTVGGAVLALAAGAAVLVLAARARREQAAAERRAQQVRLMGDVVPIVQQSLDLSVVLPAVAVKLSDHFGLAGVALAAGSATDGQHQLFAIGSRPAPAVRPVITPPDALAGGETLSLALQHGGRTIALLQIVAGEPLDEDELQSLRSVTELLTSAIANASLYASQQAALEGLRELDALKTVFLGTASHELRTPVTAISGFTTLLSANWDRFDDEQRREFVVRIGANARSLSAVVQDLLDFALLEKGTLAVTPVPLDLAAVTAGVVDRLTASFTEHELALEVETAPLVAADERALDRIVTNLLTNATKFSPPGTTVTVRVEPDPAGGGALLLISDQGPGVAPADRERIFTRFYRGSSDAITQTRGVGIGLSVVAELVDRMGGSVTVSDAPGGGACFSVQLPPSGPNAVPEETHAQAR
jgi:signal transduction histidine kinase